MHREGPSRTYHTGSGDEEPRPKHGKEIPATPRTGTERPDRGNGAQRERGQDEDRDNKLLRDPRKMMAAIGSHARAEEGQTSATTDVPEASGDLFRWGATAWGAEANIGRPPFKPTAAQTEPITTPGNQSSEGACQRAGDVREPEHGTSDANPARPCPLPKLPASLVRPNGSALSGRRKHACTRQGG